MSDTPTTQLPKDLAAEKGMVNVQIDGHWIQVPRGTRMIEACKMAEKEVPHYCYHPKLSSPGNCRMCLVQMGMPPRLAPGQEPEYDEKGYQEIGWMPRPVIACANTVAENMGIRTQGELVEKTREGVMEFLLINHPLDCPICDQAGECTLQEFSVEHGRGQSRFLEDKVKKPKNVDIGPRINLDDERCIMCSRCIRFMDEVADDAVLGFTDRGTHTTLSCHPDRKLDSNYGMNTIDLCPVGALTSKDFRFQMRVWFLKETKSIDVNCATGCNTTIWTRGNEIYRVTPRLNNDVNSEWMPDSHRLSFHEVQGDNRLTDPMIKVGHSHEPTDWDSALEAAVDALKQFEASEVAVIASARQTNEELFLSKTLADVIGTTAIATVPRTGEADGKLISSDRNPNTNGAKLILGENAVNNLGSIKSGLADGTIKALIVLNEDLFEAAGFSHEDLGKAELIISSHIIANPTAHASHIVLPSSSFAEKRGSMINVTGRLQRLNQAVQAPGNARDDWEIIRDLILAYTGEKNDLYMLEDVIKIIAQAVPAFEGITLSKIGDQGTQLIETGESIPLLEREKERVANREIVG
ncbi:NADH dehydrogenase subunit G [Rubritalea squalenifaciens DSM 18772]|uniref:NADH dehydrogenase subunit G n=1 Tax=Rubritalea squalenifaciens DSM 18772 TaxID=1123071 RepID=A0A1M6J4C9_9BACT|nr:molybdopterin-dependent oxidoreductase [Rubritalea squalenifaciens]SHJ41471.1 NADH dehydrogenase subunit G [Rubritalea squalenifaciens DSM 18772]